MTEVFQDVVDDDDDMTPSLSFPALTTKSFHLVHLSKHNIHTDAPHSLTNTQTHTHIAAYAYIPLFHTYAHFTFKEN